MLLYSVSLLGFHLKSFECEEIYCGKGESEVLLKFFIAVPHFHIFSPNPVPFLSSPSLVITMGLLISVK